MTKIPFKQHIADLALILKQHKIKHVVICPGSRNAPLIQVFQRDRHFTCYSIVDERSAGYVALGMARQLNEPVVILTTSGTAALNLSPAVAEAYFQRIPLIVLTADRPPEWPPQFGNQKINQDELFKNNVKDYYSLPLKIENENDLERVNQSVATIIGSASLGMKGPVHLNIPLMEPLYDIVSEQVSTKDYSTIVPQYSDKTIVSAEDKKAITTHLLQQKKVLLIAGMQSYSPSEEAILTSMVATFQLGIIAENLTNLPSKIYISSPELVLGALSQHDHQWVKPDLVVIFGGQVVSKKTRLFVQNLEKSTVKVLENFPLEFFSELSKNLSKTDEYENSYLAAWKKIESESLKKADEFLKDAAFCNLSACSVILESIPGQSILHLGNSGTVRYSQIKVSRPDLSYVGNRGTSGIDGSLSTAVGAAMVSDDLHVIILGDLSFVYDSNAMWNKEFPDNLKIIVLNDKEGGIFRLLDGPDRMPFFEQFSVTSNTVSIKHMAQSYGINAYVASNYKELEEGLKRVFESGSRTVLLEVETSQRENSSIFKQFNKTIQQ